MSVVEMTSSSMITGDAFESVEFSSDSDTDSWQVVDDPFDSDKDVVITSESDVITSDDDEDEDVVLDDVIGEEDDDDVITYVDEITNHTQELNEADDKAAVELVSLINGEGDQYNVKMSDLMKEDMYMEQIVMERMFKERVLDEDVVEEDEDEEDEYDEDDLDDELVPRWLNNKFERQRMRKLGKKVYPKMKKSKRVVNQYNRPGCAGAKFQKW